MKWLLVALIASWNMDAVSTDFALKDPLVREGNLFGQSRALRYTTASIAPIAIWHVTKPLSKKWRIVVFVGLAAIHSYAACHNWKLYQEYRRGRGQF